MKITNSVPVPTANDFQAFGSNGAISALCDILNDCADMMGDRATRDLSLSNKVRVGTHDWGAGATGIALDGVTGDNMVLITAGRISTAVAAGAFASTYNQKAVTRTQTPHISVFANWNELYFTSASGTIRTNGK